MVLFGVIYIERLWLLSIGAEFLALPQLVRPMHSSMVRSRIWYVRHEKVAYRRDFT